MQNLNDFEKMKQGQKMPERVLESNGEKRTEVPGKQKRVISKFEKFFCITFICISLLFVLFISISINKDDTLAKKQIQAGYDKTINSPQMQAYRAQEERRQRELEKKRRLKELGIDGISKPVQKNDLLNEQLRKQEIAEREELAASQRPQEVDYRTQLAEYNARLQEVKAEEARLRAEAAAQAQ